MNDVIIETIDKSILKRNKRKRRKERIRSYIREYLDQSSCAACGTKNNLTFHHLDPKQKKNEISKLVSYKSLKLIQNEIGKCEVLCRACHDIEHDIAPKEDECSQDITR